MKVKIPFRPAFDGQLGNGRKTCTCRTKKMGTGLDWFEHKGMFFKLTNVYQTTLADVRDRLFWHEGFDAPQGFVDIWDDIHPRKKFQPDQKVWVHRFVRVEREPKG